MPDELVMAERLRELRKCEAGPVPCPFCYWSLDAEEESGCITWARYILIGKDEQ